LLELKVRISPFSEKLYKQKQSCRSVIITSTYSEPAHFHIEKEGCGHLLPCHANSKTSIIRSSNGSSGQQQILTEPG